jgi:hypothetical protein
MTARTYRPRRVALADGEMLALRSDGSIAHLAATGEVTETWSPEDPGWARRAIRFGLHEAPETVHPSGRDVPNRIPPA